MKLLDRLSAGLGGLLGRKATELTYDQVASLIDGGSGAARVAGVTVTDKTALQVSTVLACVKAIADGCAKCPVFKVCPLKSTLGDQPPKSAKPAAQAAPVKPARARPAAPTKSGKSAKTGAARRK